jgi:hypothetical protein
MQGFFKQLARRFAVNKKDLECLIADAVKKQLEQVVGAEKYLTPEQLCERWKVSMRCLEKWRLEGKLPVYMKVQGSQKAIIRYPLHEENGVLALEKQWLKPSTPNRG